MIDSNVAYWQAKSGYDYQDTQQKRSRSGLSVYDQQIVWLATYLKSRVKQCDKRLRLLDFGCGFGRIARLCEDIENVDYYGYDFSETMVDGFRGDPPSSLAGKLTERLRVGSRVSQRYAGEAFDVILTISVLIHNDENSVRGILNDLIGLMADNGEIVLLENSLVRQTSLSNLWHGGCWMHDFAGYVAGRLAVDVDSDVLPSQAIYRLSRGQSRPSFSITTRGQTVAYDDLASFHGGVAQADANHNPTMGLDLGLAIAKLHDANEKLSQESSKCSQLQDAIDEASCERKRLEQKLKDAERNLMVLEEQFGSGLNIRRSLFQAESDRPARKPEARPHDAVHAQKAEPFYVFDAPRDCRYAHTSHPAFDDVLTVCTQEWVGIRAACGSFPGHKLAITKYHQWSASEMMQVLDRIGQLGTKTVLAQGLSPGLASFLVALRSSMPELKIYGVWHGSLAAWCHDEERALVTRFLSMADRGVYHRIHFLKRGMHLLHAKAHEPLLPNPVPSYDGIRLKRSFQAKPLTCLFGSWNNAWKNMYSNIVGAAASENVGKVISYAPVEYDGPGFKKIVTAPFSSRENHLTLCSTCDLILNATIVDCHPMLELEGLAVGTPSLRSNLDLDFGQNHPYERLFTITAQHNPAAIKAKIDELTRFNAAEIADLVLDYKKLVTGTSFERYADFLKG